MMLLPVLLNINYFNSWNNLLQVLIFSVLAYCALILMLRIAGKRSLSKMNAFDMVVTVALGSILATIILSKEIALSEGLLAFAVLLGLQYLISWLSVRSRNVSDLVKSEPRMLFFRNNFLHQAMQSERVTADEVLAAIREQGIASLEDVEAVILETAGNFTVIKKADSLKNPSYQNIKTDHES